MSEVFMTTHCSIRYALEIPSYIKMKTAVLLKKVLFGSRKLNFKSFYYAGSYE